MIWQHGATVTYTNDGLIMLNNSTRGVLRTSEICFIITIRTLSCDIPTWQPIRHLKTLAPEFKHRLGPDEWCRSLTSGADHRKRRACDRPLHGCVWEGVTFSCRNVVDIDSHRNVSGDESEPLCKTVGLVATLYKTVCQVEKLFGLYRLDSNSYEKGGLNSNSYEKGGQETKLNLAKPAYMKTFPAFIVSAFRTHLIHP
jgi:hypothetical protein